ncbi:MAG TPA: acylphosphatase [Balneolales bacterium]|nr:acylphosphatase [Balneolales bacterium]
MRYNIMETDNKRAHILLSGRVQGVGFRYFVQRTARGMSLHGWVRNLPDGRVEAVFEGDAEHVRKAIKACEIGPGTARVENINVDWEEPKESPDGFRITF